jgi:hypothetical protein
MRRRKHRRSRKAGPAKWETTWRHRRTSTREPVLPCARSDSEDDYFSPEYVRSRAEAPRRIRFAYDDEYVGPGHIMARPIFRFLEWLVAWLKTFPANHHRSTL